MIRACVREGDPLSYIRYDRNLEQILVPITILRGGDQPEFLFRALHRAETRGGSGSVPPFSLFHLGQALVPLHSLLRPFERINGYSGRIGRIPEDHFDFVSRDNYPVTEPVRVLNSLKARPIATYGSGKVLRYHGPVHRVGNLSFKEAIVLFDDGHGHRILKDLVSCRCFPVS